ncbi:MAG: DUF1059 domain-containing protein [Nitrospira sp.]|nr:MAG: DUF1059 domain-containing protein [Nitrospira sp.]
MPRTLGYLGVAPQGKCAFQMHAEMQEEVMHIVAEHTKRCRTKETLPPNLAQRSKSAIRAVAISILTSKAASVAP